MMELKNEKSPATVPLSFEEVKIYSPVILALGSVQWLRASDSSVGIIDSLVLLALGVYKC